VNFTATIAKMYPTDPLGTGGGSLCMREACLWQNEIPLLYLHHICIKLYVLCTDWSLVQRSPTDCGASLCVIKKPR